MKKIIFLFLYISIQSVAQNKQILYDFNNLPQTLLLNPGAEVYNKYHIGFPLFSQISFQGGFTGFSTYDIFANNGVPINDKIRNAINKYGNAEFIETNQQLEVINVGYRLKNNSYLSFGFYEEFNALVKIPRDLVDLFYEGNSVINRHYSIKKMAARAELFGVLHLGLSKKINKKWQVGGRFKIYSSVFNANSKQNTGEIYLENGTNNIYKQHIDNVNILVQTSGVFFDNTDVITQSYIQKKLLFGGNLGVGIDAGFTYHPEKHWTVTGSILDFGFINYKQNVEAYSVKGSYAIEGIQVNFNPANPENYWQNLKDDFDNQVALDTIYTKYTSLRPVKLNGSIAYAFGRPYYDDCHFSKKIDTYTDKMGLQLFSTVGAVHSYLAATLFYEKRINKYLQTKITYTADPFSFTNIGLGISSHFGAFNMYFAADNLISLANVYNAKSFNVQLGINFIFNNKN
jgi:hypothetical protein